MFKYMNILFVTSERSKKVTSWLQSYIGQSVTASVLEQSALAQGNKIGYSDRQVMAAAKRLAVIKDGNSWRLP
jgi:hypothetical protein